MGQFRLASLLLLLASQVNGQSLMQGLWAFAQASGVDPVAPADPGAFPPDPDAFPPDFGAFPPDSAVFPQDTGAFPPDSGAFPPDSGAFPPDTAVFPPDTGVFPPDTAVFPPDTGVFPQDTGSTQPDTGAAFPPDTRSPPPKDTGAFPPDSAAIPSEPNKDPASNPAGVDITGGKGAAGSAGKVNSPFISEPKTVSDIGQNALEKPVLDPANSAIVTGQGGHVPVVDPFGVGSGSSGKDPSLVSSSSIGMVDMITNEVQTPVEPALPILPTGGTESTGIGILTDMGLNLGLDTGLSVDASSSFGIADIIPGNAMDLPVQEIPIVPPVNSQDLPRTGQDTGFVVEPDFIPVSNTDAGSEMVIPIIGPGSIPDIGTMVDNIVVPDHPKPQPDSKPITAALEVPAPNQNTGSMSILDPSKARSFLNSLIGQPFNVDKVKPKTKATDIDVPTGWTQLYPNGRRPSKIEAGLSQLPSAVDAPAATETENQMADISNRSFGKHRNLYRQLRRERIEAKKALRNKLKQGRSGRGRSQGRQQGKGGQKTKAQALGMNKKRQRQFRTMPRRASLSIPVANTNSVRRQKNMTPRKGKGRSKRQTRRCNRGMQRRGLCSMGRYEYRVSAKVIGHTRSRDKESPRVVSQ